MMEQNSTLWSGINTKNKYKHFQFSASLFAFPFVPFLLLDLFYLILFLPELFEVWQ